MLAGTDLARRLEAAEALHDVACAQAHQRLDPALGSAVLEVAGGYAIFMGAESPLTHALGLGMCGAVRAEGIARMESFYAQRGVSVSVDVCPLAHGSLLELLAHRGYQVMEFNNVLVRDVAGTSIAPTAEDCVRLANPDEEQLWAHTVGRGFLEKDVLTPAEMDVGRSIWHMPGVRCYLAFRGDEPVAAAAMTISGGLAICFADGTLAGHRRAGWQSALVRRRLRDAAEAQCDLATASTLPGSVSQRNYERCGFQVVYTKAVCCQGGEEAA